LSAFESRPSSASSFSSAVAIDPCAANNGNCPAACAASGSGSAICYTPTTCADIAAHMPVPEDSSVTLYASGSSAKPWTALCHGGHEYLTLPTGSGSNYGQYTAGGKSPGTDVRTSYARVRVDPATLKIDICDQTFASSTGMLMHDPAFNGPDPVTSMPLGVAMDCAGNGSATGVGNIDLTGVPFVVSTTWSRGGNSAGGSAVATGSGRVVAITGGGNCGWDAPSGSPGNPFNAFSGSLLIGLTYLP